MPWLDPAHQEESTEDRELRAELRGLVGLSSSSFESNFFEAKPTPEMVKLAEGLRTEAMRRRNTARNRPMRMLLAAGLPVALVISGLGAWGYQQKNRADRAAAAAVVAASEKNKAERANESSQAQVSRDRDGRATARKVTASPIPESGMTIASTKEHRATGATTFTPSKPGKTDYPVIEVKQPLVLPAVQQDRVKAQ